MSSLALSRWAGNQSEVMGARRVGAESVVKPGGGGDEAGAGSVKGVGSTRCPEERCLFRGATMARVRRWGVGEAGKTGCQISTQPEGHDALAAGEARAETRPPLAINS